MSRLHFMVSDGRHTSHTEILIELHHIGSTPFSSRNETFKGCHHHLLRKAKGFKPWRRLAKDSMGSFKATLDQERYVTRNKYLKEYPSGADVHRPQFHWGFACFWLVWGFFGLWLWLWFLWVLFAFLGTI